jgi:hypothetical protein
MPPRSRPDRGEIGDAEPLCTGADSVLRLADGESLSMMSSTSQPTQATNNEAKTQRNNDNNDDDDADVVKDVKNDKGGESITPKRETL